MPSSDARLPFFILGVFILILLSQPVLIATPRQRNVPPRLRVKKIDQGKYNRGKQIFLGKHGSTRNLTNKIYHAMPSRVPLTKKYKKVQWEELQGHLGDGEKKDLPFELMEKLNTNQIRSLYYYLQNRDFLPKDFDSGKYLLGEQICTGKATIGNHDPKYEVKQKEKIIELQQKLTFNDRKLTNLLELSGKLTPRKFESLEYCVSLRYKLHISLNTSAYHQGESILKGKLKFDKNDKNVKNDEPIHFIVAQESNLIYLQAKLPKRVQRRRDLTNLTGKLTTDQVNALAYYLTIAFKIKID